MASDASFGESSSESADMAQEEIVEEFSFFDDWADRYRYIIDLGRNMDQLAEVNRTDGNLIRGCQSRVWLAAREEAGKLKFQAATDAAIVAGLIALIMRVYDGRTADEICKIEPWFVEKIGLKDHLSPTRSNGLHAMLSRIHGIAEAAL